MNQGQKRPFSKPFFMIFPVQGTTVAASKHSIMSSIYAHQ